ncbi:MAG: response regulator transcription factor [Oligoflexia bacterium]|nr:response regulator transcription factor [Oligoflexia bacterium]
MQASSALKSQSQQSPLSIVITEDHDLVRHALRKVIEESQQYKVVGEARDVDSTLKLIESKQPDLVLVDIGLPGKSGLEVLFHIKRNNLNCKVAFLTMYEDPQKVQQALSSGAVGYILKSAPYSDFLSALEKIRSGNIAIPQQFSSMVQAVDTDQKSSKDDPLHKLSKPERQVFFLLADGQPNRIIAKQLLISPRTVETHRARVIKKLGFSSTADLVRYAIRNNLLNA